jgi:hypothetical protein
MTVGGFPILATLALEIRQGFEKRAHGQLGTVHVIRRKALQILGNHARGKLPGRFEFMTFDYLGYGVGAGVCIQAAVEIKRHSLHPIARYGDIHRDLITAGAPVAAASRGMGLGFVAVGTEGHFQKNQGMRCQVIVFV